VRKRMAMVNVSVALTLGAGALGAEESIPEAKVRLDLILAVREGRYRLEGTLTSQDSRTLVVRKAELPWGEGRCLHLDSFIPDSGGAKLAQWPRSRPTRDAVTLEAGGTISGALNLDTVFAGFDGMLKTHPVIIFWAYQVVAGDSRVTSEWQAGSFVVPKGGLGEGATLR
jgi:hypothetical protein